jgi:antitoxin FitA
MTKVSVELSENEAGRLEETARSLGLRPADLARAAVSDLLGHPQEDFENAAQRVLRENGELYRRLS